MIFIQFLSLGILLCALWASTYATSCPDGNSRCINTAYVLNTCTGTLPKSTCSCINETYIPVDFGCADKSVIPKPAIKAGKYSGEVHTAQTLDLFCDVDGYWGSGDAVSRKWFVDGAVQPGEASRTWTYSPAAAGEDKQITCQLIDAYLESPVSDSFNVKSFASGSTPSISPTISHHGFTKVVTGNSLEYRCINLPKDDIKYSWTGSGGSPAADSIAKIPSSDLDGSALTCTVELTAAAISGGRTQYSPKPTASTTLPSAADVGAASSLITGVEIDSYTSGAIVNPAVTNLFSCQPTPTHVKFTTETDIKWTWESPPGTPITGETASRLPFSKLSAGSNTIVCIGTPTGGSPLPSAPFSITLSADLVVPKTIVSPLPVVESGYMAIRCIVFAASISGIEYLWMEFDSSTELLGLTDHALQVNGIVDATHTAAKSYGCIVKKGDFIGFPSPYSTTAIAVASVTPTVLTSKATTNYVTDRPYTLTCQVTDPATAHIKYKWYKDGVLVSGMISRTYDIIANTTSAGAYTCAGTFGSTDTATSAAETVAPKPIGSVTISGLTSPVQGQSVKYTCTATALQKPAYVWKKDGTAVPGETSSTYTISPVSAGDGGTYTCQATLSSYPMSSNKLVVTPVTTPATPSVVVPSVINVGGSYTFTCTSESADSSHIYEWKFTPTLGTEATLPGTSQTYKISSISSGSDAGDYKCKVTVGSAASAFSAPTTVAVGATIGLPCTVSNFGTVCTRNFAIYTGNCVKDRCECAPGVKTLQNDCEGGDGDDSESGASVIVASILMTCLSLLAGPLM